MKIANSINKEFDKSFSQKLFIIKYRKSKKKSTEKLLKVQQHLFQCYKQITNKEEASRVKNPPMASLSIVAMFQKNLFEHFSDVMIIDTSHKTNRFNLVFLDAVVITNIGKTSVCFFGLLENKKIRIF